MGQYYAGPPPELVALAIPILFIIVAGLVAVTAIVSVSIRNTVQHAHTERTRRDLAAFVAEGSITPEDAERLLVATPAARRHGLASRTPGCGPGDRRRPMRRTPERDWS
ncbi:MAG: hypothetical protein AAGG07_10505 [Planctomycetota bacterium]